MHKKSQKGVSVFSGVATLYKAFDNKYFSFLFHNLSWLLIIVGAVLAWFCLTPQSQLKLDSTDVKRGELYLIILTANAVLVIMVTSLRYFYKDTLLKFDKVDEIVDIVRDFIIKLPDVSLSDEKKKQTEYFIAYIQP